MEYIEHLKNIGIVPTKEVFWNLSEPQLKDFESFAGEEIMNGGPVPYNK